ncbi:hypothetical protein V565_208720, partial [Rhizoctonia solani 123E]
MPKRGRTSQGNSERLDYTVTFYDDALATTTASPPAPTVDIQWFGEPVQSSSPSVAHRTLGKRRKTAPKTTTVDIKPSEPATNSLATAEAKREQLNLGPPNNISDDKDEWEDVNEPFALPPDEFVTQSDDAKPKKNSNYYLREWLHSSCDSYVRLTYEHDTPPSGLCAGCDSPVAHLYRCATCLGNQHLCVTCLKDAHTSMPTHRIQEWTGNIWRSACLANLGLVLYLGHGGRPCPDILETSNIHVGDLGGYVDVRVQYCKHDLDASITKAQQLIRARLFPCSDLRPKSAFTFNLLDTFNIFTTLGRTSAYKFDSVLTRITKPGFPTSVKDRYRELIYTHRRYLHVLNLRRAGHLFDHHPDELHPGDQALDCFSCPRPGINFNWEEVLPHERPYFRSSVSWDGNFCNVRKAKKVDSGDISLSDGKGYSPHKQTYKDWTKLDHGKQRDEKPTCDHHKAGNDVSVRFNGRDVTGIGALTCSSHSCYIPRGMVDFFQGELFIYADYGFASGLKYMTQGGKLAIMMTYDIMCHWLRKFKERVKKLPPEIEIPLDLDLVGAIPKWHLVGHIPECYVRYSLDHTQYVGRIDGEGVERVWAHQNEHSGSTSEQGPGMRTDSMTNVAEQWNFEIMCRLEKALPERYRKAQPEYIKQKKVHEELTAEFPQDKIAAWEVESLEPTQDLNGKWVSPLMDPIFVNGDFHSTVRAEREQESETARKTSRRPGVTRWISAGIELEHSMKKIQEKEKALGKSPTMQQNNSLNAQRLAARDRISAHEKKRLTYMGETDTPNHPEFSPIVDDAMDGAIVIMPSSYNPETLTSAGLSSLAELEGQLRRAMCGDTLETIRQMLGAKAFTVKYKNQHARGQGATTRAQAAIKEQTEKLQQAKWRYTNSRNALLRLGLLGADDKDKYLELTDADLKTLKSYIEETSRGLRQGHAAIPWIWRTSVVKNKAEWEISILRTEWFRSRERYKRWEEQLILLKREMVMGIRSFLKHREIWAWKAVQPSTTPGMQGYALARAEWFKDLAVAMYKSCRQSLE